MAECLSEMRGRFLLVYIYIYGFFGNFNFMRVGLSLSLGQVLLKTRTRFGDIYIYIFFLKPKSNPIFNRASKTQTIRVGTSQVFTSQAEIVIPRNYVRVVCERV